MRGKKSAVGLLGSLSLLGWLGLAGLCVFVPQGQAQAFIVINEILADPPAGLLGDANADGVGSITQDEFVEFFNPTTNVIDISGWSLSDAVKTRHIFTSGSIFQPRGVLVVFGGGHPQLPDIDWFTASTGMLGLNNDTDIITLLDQNGETIDQVTYGREAGQDQSVARSPEGTGNIFVQHLSLANADERRFSPGYFINPVIAIEPDVNNPPGQDAQDGPVEDNSSQGANPNVPEPATICYLASGLGLMLFKRRK